MIECRKFRIRGRVQGVWFRESTSQQANRLGVRGHALNCPDGTVEVLACGSPEALATLRGWLRQGPPLAEVASLLELACDDDCPEGFTTGWSS